MGSVSVLSEPSTLTTMSLFTLTHPLLPIIFTLLTLTKAQDENIGSRHPVDLKQAESDMRAVDESIGNGKLFFTGTGYTVNLIPHAIVLGLLALGVVFLFGDSLFGADSSTGS